MTNDQAPGGPTATEPESLEEEGFRGACLQHLPSLYAMALRLTRNASDAEDLVQETYLKAVRKSSDLDPCMDCKAWLFKIMTNSYIDQYRKASRTPPLVELDEGDSRAVAEETQANPERSLLATLLDEDVVRALDELPENYRMPVLLFDVEGFSYAEIADMMEIPVGTVMSRLYRGRRLLRKSLVDYAKSKGYAS